MDKCHPGSCGDRMHLVSYRHRVSAEALATSLSRLVMIAVPSIWQRATRTSRRMRPQFVNRECMKGMLGSELYEFERFNSTCSS